MSFPKFDELPPPKDLSHRLSKSAQTRAGSRVKALYKYFKPGVGQLAGGLPYHAYFPFDTLEACIAHPDRWQPTPNNPVEPPYTGTLETQQSSSRLFIPTESKVSDPDIAIDVKSALQYGTSEGYRPLHQWIRHFVREHMHNQAYAGGLEIIPTCGSTDGFAKSLLAFHNEWLEGRDPLEDREGLLVEKYSYMNAIQAARPRGANIVPVAIDEEGMCADGPGGLRDILENWDLNRGKRPHLIYTVTMGQIPTSGVQSLARRRAIYSLCSKYDIILIEDDPYWFLQYPSASSDRSSSQDGTSGSLYKSGYPFLDSLVPSYLSIDVDGRVVRLDTFSKTIAPGCRAGWITAQPALIERFQRITEVTTQQPNGFVQSMLATMLMGLNSSSDASAGTSTSNCGHRAPQELAKGFQVDGWVRWLEGLQGNYERRMNSMVKILREHQYGALSTSKLHDLQDWTVLNYTQPLYSFYKPQAGMFLWLRVHFEEHQLWPYYNTTNKCRARFARAVWVMLATSPYLVVVVPGFIFAPTKEIEEAESWQFLRLSFAACPEDDVAKLTRKVVEGLEGFWALKTPEAVERLLDNGADDDDTLKASEDCLSLAGCC